MNKKRTYIISIDGNIGSGKTTFLNKFEKYCIENNIHYKILKEPISLWQNFENSGRNLLDLYYIDPIKWGFIFQSYVQLTLFNQIQYISKNESLVITERSLLSSYFVFTKLQYKLKYIDFICFKILTKWFNLLSSLNYFNLNLIIYLQTQPDVAFKRLMLRSRKEEKKVDIRYIEKLHYLYENWIKSTNQNYSCKIITIKNNKLISEKRFNYWFKKIINVYKYDI